MRRPLAALVGLAIALGAAIPSSAAVINLNPVSDRDGDVVGGTLNADGGTTLTANKVTTTLDRRFALEFKISSIPTTATVNSATLTLTESKDGSTDPVELYGYVGNGTATFTDLSAGTLVDANIADASAGTSIIDVASFLQTSVTAGDIWVGFRASRPLPTASNYTIFSMESNTKPLLTVNYSTASNSTVPEPASATLFAVGACAMFGFGRRQRRRKTAS